MVRLNSPSGSIVNGEFMPVMFRHTLVSVKDAAGFKSGNQYSCYITKYDGGRFAVFTSHGSTHTIYYVFKSEQELHDHFDEITP